MKQFHEAYVDEPQQGIDMLNTDLLFLPKIYKRYEGNDSEVQGSGGDSFPEVPVWAVGCFPKWLTV